MPLCFIEPQEAIRVVAESVGREARRQLLGEVVRAWVDEIPEDELLVHYAKAVDELDDDDLSILAAWHASLEVGQPIANKEFLLGAFSGSRRAPARGTADRGRVQGRGRLRGRGQRGAGARHGAAVAVARPAAGARRGGGGAVLLGPPRQRQLAARIASPGGVLGRSRALARVAPCVLARLALRTANCRCPCSGSCVFAGCTADSATDSGDPSERTPARVTRHTDGDTLWLSGIGKVRLIGIDTPEVFGQAECYGRQASAFVERLLPLGARVQLLARRRAA